MSSRTAMETAYRDLQQLVDQGQDGTAIRAAQERCATARHNFIEAEFASLSGGILDGRLRGKLMALYGCRLAERDPSIGVSGRVSWDDMVADLFEWPASTSEAEEAFAQLHAMPRIKVPSAT